MHNIGDIIQERRSDLGLTRTALSKDICSEKFLYLIEKGDRKPSAPILRLLSNRLGVELFEYYQYLDCKEPSKVRDAMLQCSRLRRVGDFAALKELNVMMQHLPDFGVKPWKYEIEVNRFAIMLYQDYAVQRVVDEIESLVAHIEPAYADEEFTAGLYGMLTNGYEMLMDIENAKRASNIAKTIIANKRGNARYHQIYISVKLTAMSLAKVSGDFCSAIEEGLEIIQYQEETSSYERLNVTYYFLASAYYLNGQIETAFQWFDKCLLNLLTFYRPSIARFIFADALFDKFTGDERTKTELVRMLKQFYAE